MDLIDDPQPGENAPEFTVSEISGAVKKTIEGAFGRVRVRGEVGRVMLARSGHLYFDVKDDRSVIAAVSWKGQVSRLSIMPEEGMEVIVSGKITTFGSQSKYQINVDDVVVAGEGALMAMLEKRKKALAAEGLFAPERKKKLPFLPEVIGVVTSPSGAVIRDILHRLRDRFPRKVLIWPVAVQGDACAPQVAAAIEGFNRLTPGGALPRPDLLIVARGGGSIEDLWGFNEEVVARAAAASDIPLISAVGHETDTTLIDFVSDLRAPTPTAAAEHAVPVRLELLAWTEEQGTRLTRSLEQGVGQRGQRLRDLARALPRAEALLDGPRQRLDTAGLKLPAALTHMTQARRVKLTEAAAGLRPRALTARLAPLRDKLDGTAARLGPGLSRGTADHRRELNKLSARLDAGRIREDNKKRAGQVRDVAARLDHAYLSAVARQTDRLVALERMRQTLGYTETLKRGYAVVRGDGDVVTTQKAASKAGALEIEFADGRLSVGDATATAAKPKAKPTKPSSPGKTDPGQGSLF
ncbi:exodeoxyribonuclease VII large subunit [Aliiroseovarius sp. F20344]|uniref:exodeoxyribonuclease VII large subunit n=1 Tax=Aliiroseovarius sp. F20344 TaxID=2926414 RepID=UPI001FF5FD24|nr:exodeoxyribonuclease VII large subunit [Aliiroseovarius sp. F20344]MCK0142686.1 exodeoxyribonuclease VII large subunit [Aliiroseovarius sp. F20344]